MEEEEEDGFEREEETDGSGWVEEAEEDGFGREQGWSVLLRN